LALIDPDEWRPSVRLLREESIMLEKKRFAMLAVILASLATALIGTARILADDPPMLTPTPPDHPPTREEERTSVDGVSGKPIEMFARHRAYYAKRYQISSDQEVTVPELIEVEASTHPSPCHQEAAKGLACPSLLDLKLRGRGAPALTPSLQE
jgi:hypothetical protein